MGKEGWKNEGKTYHAVVDEAATETGLLVFEGDSEEVTTSTGTVLLDTTAVSLPPPGRVELEMTSLEQPAALDDVVPGNT